RSNRSRACSGIEKGRSSPRGSAFLMRTGKRRIRVGKDCGCGVARGWASHCCKEVTAANISKLLDVRYVIAYQGEVRTSHPSFLVEVASQQETRMQRRQWLKSITLGAGAAGLPFLSGGPLAPPRSAAAQETEARKLPPLKITDVKTVLTAPARIRLVVVKVLTSEPGLYGLG